MTDATNETGPIEGEDFVMITLTKPLMRGETSYSQIRLNKPGSPECQGCDLLSLVQMNVTQVHKVLPRITQPAVSPADFIGGSKANIDISILFEMAGEIAGFLLGKQKLASL